MRREHHNQYHLFRKLSVWQHMGGQDSELSTYVGGLWYEKLQRMFGIIRLV